MSGYLHESYARSLADFGTPRALSASGGWILQRRVPGADADDAMGCYPLFACRDWSRLGADVDALAGDIVALSLVSDPLGEYEEALLRSIFPDVCRPFKHHFVVDLGTPADPLASAHHRRNLRLAQQEVEVVVEHDPTARGVEWVRLYDQLIARHSIRGIPAFSPGSLLRQLRVPGLTMLRAVHQGTTAGITLWYAQSDDAVYYHLGAYSETGYEVRASFALFQFAIEHFRGRARWLDLGAGAGAEGDGSDGLTRFKRGWATGTRVAWLCGRVLHRSRYEELMSSS